MSAEVIQRLEERVSRLEQELERLRAQVNNSKESDEPCWKSWVGVDKDDPIAAEVNESIRKAREKDRERAIRRIEKAEAAEKARPEKVRAKRAQPAKSNG